jgi:MoxR-like ATPase
MYQPPLIGAVTEGELVDVDEIYAVDPDTDAVLFEVVLEGIVI